MKNEKPVAIYCRVARMDDYAIKNQESMLLDYAKQHDYEIAKVYTDNGFSCLNFGASPHMHLL